MPRPRINLDLYRYQIEEWRADDAITIQEIQRRLKEEYNISASATTLWRSLRNWGSDMKRGKTEDTEELRTRIKQLFFQFVLNDHFILRQLQDEGFTITPTGLTRIRRDLGLWRRQDPGTLDVQLARLREFFETDSERSTMLRTYGRTYLYTYIRQNYHVLSRDVIYHAFREFYPRDVTQRWNAMRYRRVGWTCPGPDFIWSIDAHDKLKHWGFEIYASIDAYSRYITWFYIGISASTARSVVGQYLSVLQAKGVMPYLVRSDRGGETVLMAGAHFYLSQHRLRKRDGVEGPITFRQCWIYGKSTANEKIESWWLRFSQGRGGFWRVCSVLFY